MKSVALFLVFSCCFSWNSVSQDYTPFPTTTATWQEASEYIGFGFNAWSEVDYEMIGDTVISELDYKKIYVNTYYNGGFNLFYVGGLREDENKKVFFKPDSMIVGDSYENSNWASEAEPLLFPSDSIEYMIYDFSELEIGDTLFYNNSLNPDYLNVVLDVDSTLIDDSFRKIYAISEYPNWIGTSYLIEGIGSSKGLLASFKTRNKISFSKYQLNCFTHESVFFQNPFEDEVIDCQVGLSISENMDSGLAIFPNPCTSLLHMHSLKATNSDLYIYNSIGALIHYDRINSSKIDIDVSLFETGVYTLHVLNDEGSFAKRFIKE